MSTPRRPVEASPLEGLSNQLITPLPQKTRFLHELNGDLRDLTRRFVSDGLPADEARRRAFEALVPDETAVAHLEKIHRSWYRRQTRKWTDEGLRRFERTLLTGAFVVLLVAETGAILQVDFSGYVSAFLWPVMATGTGVVLLVLAKAFELWIKEEHRTPRRGLRALVGLSVLPSGIALIGIQFDVLRLAGTLERNPEQADALVIRSLIENCVTLSLAVLFGLFGAIGWLVFTQWIAIQEDAHRRALALHPSSSEEV